MNSGNFNESYINPNDLLADEVDFELKLRNLSKDGNIQDRRQKLRRAQLEELRKPREFAYKISISQEYTSIKSKVRLLQQALESFPRTNHISRLRYCRLRVIRAHAVTREETRLRKILLDEIEFLLVRFGTPDDRRFHVLSSDRVRLSTELENNRRRTMDGSNNTLGDQEPAEGTPGGSGLNPLPLGATPPPRIEDYYSTESEGGFRKSPLLFKRKLLKSSVVHKEHLEQFKTEVTDLIQDTLAAQMAQLMNHLEPMLRERIQNTGGSEEGSLLSISPAPPNTPTLRPPQVTPPPSPLLFPPPPPQPPFPRPPFIRPPLPSPPYQQPPGLRPSQWPFPGYNLGVPAPMGFPWGPNPYLQLGYPLLGQYPPGIRPQPQTPPLPRPPRPNDYPRPPVSNSLQSLPPRDHQRNRQDPEANTSQLEPNSSPRNRYGIPVSKWRISFSGDKRGPSVTQFISRVEIMAKNNQVTERELLGQANFLFTQGSPAEEWYYSFYHKFDSWTTFKHQLRLRFEQLNKDSVIERQILDREQLPHETFHVFMGEIERLAQQLSKPMPEERKLRILKENMRDNYKPFLTLYTIQTIDELVAVCHNLDTSMHKTYTGYPRNRHTQVHNLEEENPEGNSAEAEDEELNAIHRQFVKKKSADNVRQEQGTILCWNCRKFGHFWRDCQEAKRIFCHFCGQINYTTSNCPNQHQFFNPPQENDDSGRS